MIDEYAKSNQQDGMIRMSTGMQKDQMQMNMAGIPDWLYYSSIVFIILLTLFVLEYFRKKGNMKDGSVNYWKYNLTGSRMVKRLVKSRLFQVICQLIVILLFILILFAGFYGRQLPGRNIAPILTWNIWWIGLIFIILFFGKLWCYVCPWYSISDWISRLSIFRINKNTVNMGWKWPEKIANIYPAALLFIFLTWLEIGFNVTGNPEATAALGVLMFGLVFIPSLLFEKKPFCRYGCLVGRISGLYAMFSPVEVRSGSKKICEKCKTEDCFNGSTGGYGCPTGQNLKMMQENTYCIMCGECFRTCPHNNVVLNARPFGKDLAMKREPKIDESHLSLIIFSITAFHGLSMTPVWKVFVSFIQNTFSTGYITSFTAAMSISLSVPVIAYSFFIWISKIFSGGTAYTRLFMQYAYGLIPIALFYHIAHNVEHFFLEGQKLFILISDPFGYGWDIFGTADKMLKPILTLHAVWFIQVVLIIIGHIFGVYITHRHANMMFSSRIDSIKSQIPLTLLMILFSMLSLWLVAQPMEMRSGM